jgi:hypothetical protein
MLQPQKGGVCWLQIVLESVSFGSGVMRTRNFVSYRMIQGFED